MENQLISKLHIELGILVLTIELANTQFSQYSPKVILKHYNDELKILGLTDTTLTIMEKYLDKLKEIKIIAKFYTKDRDCGILCYYKLNCSAKQAQSKISDYLLLKKI